MAEEHPKATFIWRKTTWKRETLHTLMGWENVLSKKDLPYEYTDRGSRFWEAGSTIHISSSRCPELYIGKTFGLVDFGELLYYLESACEWLRRVKLKVGEAEEIRMEVEARLDMDISKGDTTADTIPTVVLDTEVVVIGKPTLLERVERILHGWNTEESKEVK